LAMLRLHLNSSASLIIIEEYFRKENDLRHLALGRTKENRKKRQEDKSREAREERGGNGGRPPMGTPGAKKI